MADVLSARVASATAVRQAHVVSRMRSTTLAVQAVLQSEVDQLAETLQRRRGASIHEVQRLVLRILARAVDRTRRAIDTQLRSAAAWAYQSAADSMLAVLPTEQLSWIALAHLLPSAGPVGVREQKESRFSLADAIAAKNAWGLSAEVKAALVASAKDMGASGSATLLLKLLNAFPPNVPKKDVFKLVKAKVDASHGQIPPAVVAEFANYGGLQGRIVVGAPASLHDWWQMGFHRLPAERKAEILKQYVFPPPSQAAVDGWLKAPANAYGMEGLDWQARLLKTSKLIADPSRLAAAIAHDIASGKGVYGVMQSVLPQMQNYKVSAQRVARMEVARVCAAANEAVLEDAGDVVAGVQINAVLDVATRPEHASRHGRIYWKGTSEWEGRPSLPDDYNCRCYYSAVLRPPTGVQQNPDLLKSFDSEAGPVMDPLVYGQWFGKASDVERQTVVGAKRYAAMAAKLGSAPTWSDFVDDQGNLRSLDQIKGATAAEVLAWRAANARKFAALHDQLREIRQKSFLVNPPITPTIPAAKTKPRPTTPTVTPLDGFPPGWSKVVTPSGRSQVTSFVGPTGDEYRTIAAARAAMRKAAQRPKSDPSDKLASKKPEALTPVKTPSQVREALLSDRALSAARKRLEAAKRERDALWAKIYDGVHLTAAEAARLDELRQFIKRAPSLSAVARRRLLVIAKARNPQPIKTSTSGIRADKATKDRLNTAVKFVSKLTETTDRDIARRDGKPFQVDVEINQAKRATASPSEGKIWIANDTTTQVVVHELGHLFERDQAVLAAVTKFVEKRAGNKLIDLRQAVPESDYLADEQTRTGWESFLPAFDGDRNRAAYAAKHYVSGLTEIVSMGLEEMYLDPVRFAREDPEFFDLILNVVRGTLE